MLGLKFIHVSKRGPISQNKCIVIWVGVTKVPFVNVSAWEMLDLRDFQQVFGSSMIREKWENNGTEDNGFVTLNLDV